MKLVLFLQIAFFTTGFVLGKFLTLPIIISAFISLSFLFTSFQFHRKERSLYSLHVFRGLIFCVIGDFVLMNLIPGGMILGMLSFGLGHAFFITGYVKTIKFQKGKIANRGTLLCSLVYYVYFLFIWLLTSYNSDKGPVFIWGSLVYGFLVSTMAVMGFALYLNNKTYLLTALGAAAFLLSDSIISLTQTYDIKFGELLIKATYYFALFGIIYSNRKSWMYKGRLKHLVKN